MSGRGLATLAAGAFLITLAALLRGVVAPAAFALPAVQSQVIRLTDGDASYLDTARLAQRRGVPVEMTVARYGDTGAATRDTAVWTEFLSLTAVDGPRIDYHERRVAFDRRGGGIVDCCGSYLDEDDQTAWRGLAFRWPVGARPVPYRVFDPVVRRPVTAWFDGVERVRGTLTYRYTQRFVNEAIPQPAPPLPARLLGLGGKADAEHPTAAFLDGRRTHWVDPVSGMVVAVREEVTRTLRTADRRGEAVAFRAELRTTEESERQAADQARAFRFRATAVKLVLPGTFLLAGLSLLWYSRRSLRAARPAAAPEPPPADTTDPPARS
ncbi:DUF3068 domain-containing protein [Spongiactinospora sp. TRM90649]|uniref:DUF3068 domain-containing protein n=1 Tax=Spongiactinospora sp. TRM90649 TaxID=3031114 RepID=UPI0023F8570A|nr:DUF3068 domain-containing protein [Spongiactinospora sp. TRM90649]MDF5751058.1 DUF3068 domain-containing protein [Spongiactinospora sp. TRM90649]